MLHPLYGSKGWTPGDFSLLQMVGKVRNSQGPSYINIRTKTTKSRFSQGKGRQYFMKPDREASVKIDSLC